MDNPNDIQIGGQHYRDLNPSFQHWDLVARYQMNYFLGNMTKYVCRWRKKNGLKDLEKAKHYLDKLMSLYEQGITIPNSNLNINMGEAREFCEEQRLSETEKIIVLLSVQAFYMSDLLHLSSLLEQLIVEASQSESTSQHSA